MPLILTPSQRCSISATIRTKTFSTTFYCCERTSKFPDLLILVWLNDDHLDSFRVSFLIYWLLDWLIDYMATCTVRYVSRLYLSATYAELHTSVTPIDEMTSVRTSRRKRVFHDERSTSSQSRSSTAREENTPKCMGSGIFIGTIFGLHSSHMNVDEMRSSQAGSDGGPWNSSVVWRMSPSISRL